MNEDLYSVLGVSRDCSTEDIKKAYRNLAKKYHPDVNNENNEVFSKILDAYTVLKDEQSRSIYDSTGSIESIDLDKKIILFLSSFIIPAILNVEDISNIDVVYSSKMYLGGLIDGNNSKIEKLNDEVLILEESKKRFRLKKDSKFSKNIFAEIISQKIQSLKLESIEYENEIVFLNSCIDFLDNFEFIKGDMSEIKNIE